VTGQPGDVVLVKQTSRKDRETTFVSDSQNLIVDHFTVVYFDRIVASNSERASKGEDARGMALFGRSREVGKGLLSRRLRRSAKG